MYQGPCQSPACAPAASRSVDRSAHRPFRARVSEAGTPRPAGEARTWPGDFRCNLGNLQLQHTYSQTVKNRNQRRPHASPESGLAPELVAILLSFVGHPRTAHAALQVIDGWDAAPSPPLGSFYRHLKRAVALGWLEILDRPAETPKPAEKPARGPGRPSRRYRLTAEGTQALRAALEHARGLVHLAHSRHLLAHEALP